jgi:hypothetical protein
MKEESFLVYEKLALINKELPAVAKSSKNAHQGWKYRSAEDLMNALHPIMAKHGVFLCVGNIKRKLWERDSKNWTHCILEVQYHWMASDGSIMPCVGFGEAKDNGDKVVGKCLTYALKTMLQTVFVIPTEDTQDPDAYIAPPSEPVTPKETGIYQSMPEQKKTLTNIVRAINPEVSVAQLKTVDKHMQGVAMTGLEAKIKEFLK